ncbi:hypothetical protein MJO28_002108 [Puccinia striiformis f. sp. tritici]|uniref:Uncharacterized protein n=1 Tax=Puccinia striiformis f. sp. tritici TaxID=168172 RepID=A0ACC0EV43_9BASI|nr:hypothetical protein Pst134EB_003779 [Puccinia striiformis f. sp. tritici]KAI7961619.1 hypothetical protein MJO28_002108 [Puccinia striiformis f. sp. tritici]KAI7966434.1 hypothetical protein MJO29_002182 [Puccinia striiformis f. sp. tritici]
MQQENENENENNKQQQYDQLLPGEGNLWGSILDSVSNNREKSNLPTKKVIVLGERNSGKSALVSYLSTTNQPSTDPNLNPNSINNNSNGPIGKVADDDDDVDMGTNYTTVEIGDDSEDDPLVRLSIHQIPSASPPYSNLLPLILNADSLRESLILVLIPFTHPHSLLTTLVRWLVLIQSVIKSIKDTIKPAQAGQAALRGEYIIEESKEALEYQYRSYLESNVGINSVSTPLQEPTSESTIGTNNNINTQNNTNIHLDLPLPPGTLTENLGIGIVIVCTKSDQIDHLEKDKDFKEEQFDFIQQVLRSICLRFGGSLFFTNLKKPQTLERLRSYILHRLFGQLISTTASIPTTTTTAATTTTTSHSRLFGFPYKANVVDRDEVLIPMGWDSWGKIKILRDGFDPSVVGNGWLFDLQKPPKTRTDDDLGDDHDDDDDQFGFDENGRKIVSACKLWEDMIGETDDESPLINPHDRVSTTSEQNFLKTKYELIKKERDLDPRSHFQQLTNNKGHSHSAVHHNHNHNHQSVKYTNGISLNDKHLGSITGTEEEINNQLNKLALRDQQGNPHGRNSNASLSPVEILHLQQQQQQQQQQQINQTPRHGIPSGINTSNLTGTQTKGTNPAMMMGSPLSSRSTNFAHHQSILLGLNSSTSNGTSSPAGTPGSQGEKAMLANFFGKLLDKDPVGARGISSSMAGSQAASSPSLPPSSSNTIIGNNGFLKSNNSNNPPSSSSTPNLVDPVNSSSERRSSNDPVLKEEL